MNSTLNDITKKSRDENQLLISEADSAMRPSVGITFTWVVWRLITKSRYCDEDFIYGSTISIHVTDQKFLNFMQFGRKNKAKWMIFQCFG